MLLEESHQDRRGNVIGEICDDAHRPEGNRFLTGVRRILTRNPSAGGLRTLPAAPFLLPSKFTDYLIQVCLQNVLVDDRHIVIPCQGLLQNRDQVPVDLDGYDFRRRFRQILG